MVRSRRVDDLDRCVEVLRAVHETDRYPAIWPTDPKQWLAGSRTIAAWVAEHEDELAGHLALTAPDPAQVRERWLPAVDLPPERLGVVSRFFVGAGRRNRGIGAALMSCAEREARERGLQLVLDVAGHNHAAIAFYDGRGWRRVGRATLSLGDDHPPLRLLLFAGPDVDARP